MTDVDEIWGIAWRIGRKVVYSHGIYSFFDYVHKRKSIAIRAKN